ncbi:DMT family transporter [Aliiruegeria lutimaris]|uniref:S-adenosylmethionine uptake transporter n=1 Tax=Aliiruegeria lutimaris TaxID=571298 RepID=A0A1G8YGJ2_9RHOB|nr:DMT family transporter [Aliiruegeria lutimaris]SDK01544.1 S-adenosylmethionine uptake transporter [Aliiruegeria lutimaris]
MTTTPTAPLNSQPTAPQIDNIRGVVLMALAFALFSVCDMQAKLLTGEFHPVQIVWTRQLALLAGVVVALGVHGPGLFRSRHPALQVVRGLLVVASAASFISAIRFVPLADAVAVTFIAPFIVTILSARLLGEHVSWQRWMAVAVGFLGAMIVIRPGMGVMHPAMLLIVVAATCFALRQVLSRRLAASDRTITTVAYTAIVSVATLSLPLFLFWQSPETGRQWALLGGMALTAALGEWLVIRALEIGQAVVLAPIHYSMMIWATFWGWLIFDDLPDGWTVTGTAVIMITGLYILRGERSGNRLFSFGKLSSKR